MKRCSGARKKNVAVSEIIKCTAAGAAMKMLKKKKRILDTSVDVKLRNLEWG